MRMGGVETVLAERQSEGAMAGILTAPENGSEGASESGTIRRGIAGLRRAQGPIGSGLGIALSLASLAVILGELREQGMAPLAMLAQSGAAFWIVFTTGLLVEPVTEYCILRRLLGAGRELFPPLVRKQALNNLLFGYAGDTYLAAWLQQHIGNTRKAITTVCDLAIASALVNNAATVILLILVWQPVQKLAGAHLDGWTMAAAVALVAVPVLLVAWRRVRAPEGSMGTILAFQSGRTVVATLLVALTWHFALPEVSLLSWMLLMAARMVVSRLPIVPNKDLAFAGIVSLFMGADSRIAPMVAAVALLTFVAQGVLITLLTVVRRPRVLQGVLG
ncbi:MAG TPA: hypothetical protein VF503_26460 [Sphingobium sp.]|uniref:hypothetical protein n=1 Tax=Sphingobium sp. TaxID=1912891 RepID=UPI002ED4A675